MISSILIANRGEIACRIIRTARWMGMRTVAVYSDADAGALHVRQADEAIHIGAAPARESYLVHANILAAAKATGAEAIHPGYGFLSENAAFAEAVQAAGVVWVGAPPASIRAMGLKDAAKILMMKAGVPVTPGYLGEDQSPGRLQHEADAIGYPVLIKAVAGGGGRGMRKVDTSPDFLDALDSCRREAAASFGDDRVLIEKYILGPRHIEVQVFGDSQGNVVHLFERDCSLQRRHQKIIEEAPAPGMDAATRAAICEAAVTAAKAIGYVGAGTIEFIADASQGLRPDRIWFMEMNTRLQVEHPVTEAITGQDLVEWQLRVASGEVLPLRQDQLAIAGWAMEARLYAENPSTGFLPSTGPLDHLRFPEGVRVDSGVEQGDSVSSYYDPMIAKLISSGPTRRAAAANLAAACRKIEVWPVKTNAALLARIAADQDFIDGRIDTAFIENNLERLATGAEPSEPVQIAAARGLFSGDPNDPWSALVGFRVNDDARPRIDVEIAGLDYSVELSPGFRINSSTLIEVMGQRVLFRNGEVWPFRAPAVSHSADSDISSDGAILSPMPGRIVALEIALGDIVVKGQKLLVLEAMKMEHALLAPFDGEVTELNTTLGAQTIENVVIARIERAESNPSKTTAEPRQ